MPTPDYSRLSINRWKDGHYKTYVPARLQCAHRASCTEYTAQRCSPGQWSVQPASTTLNIKHMPARTHTPYTQTHTFIHTDRDRHTHLTDRQARIKKICKFLFKFGVYQSEGTIWLPSTNQEAVSEYTLITTFKLSNSFLHTIPKQDITVQPHV